MAANGIETYGAFRDVMSPVWRRDNALFGGTDALRAEASEYLPRFAQETDKNYQRRLSLASLTNFYMQAASTMLGLLFKEPAELSDSTIAENVLNNIDRRGNSISSVAEKVGELLCRKSNCLLIIDHPTVSEQLNLAQQIAKDIRHYWVVIPPENVVDIRFAFVDGLETIVHVRWIEESIGKGENEFDFVARKEICVFDRPMIEDEFGNTSFGPPRARRYRQTIDFSSPQSSVLSTGLFEPVNEWIDLPNASRIPAVAFQINRTGTFAGRPLLGDIAEKNLEHWRQSSNYGNALEIGAFPVLARFGFKRNKIAQADARDDEGQMLLGPHMYLDAPPTTEGADLRYVEPSGASYEALERALDRIVAEAELMSINMLVREARSTATEATIDRIDQLSPLQKVATEIERGISVALEITAELRGARERPGKLVIDKNFGLSVNERMIADALHKARSMGDVSRRAYLQRLKELGVFDQNADTDAIAAEADNEQAERGLASQFSQDVVETL